jgi:hypothetical protein
MQFNSELIIREPNPSFILLEILGDSIRAFIYEYKGGKVQITKGSLKDAGEKTEQ